MRIRPVETSGLPMPFQRRGQGPVIVGSPDPLAWANKADGAKHAWDFIANAARWNGQYIGALANTPNWTFTRASTGYAQTSAGVLVPFASGELRRTDKGVLIEGARTNLCLQSQTFDNASWTKARSSISANTAVAPDGTTTADSFIEDSTATNTHELRCTSITKAASAIQYAGSFYAKANTRSWLRVMIADSSGGTNRAQAWFDLTNGVVGTKNTAGAGFTADSLSISALGNGWYRCTLVATTDSSTAVFLNCALATGDVNTTYSGDGASGVYLWGAQLEAAAFPSSYIPTTTASATRAADVLTVPVSGIDYPLTLFAEWEKNGDDSVNPYQRVIEVGRASATDRAVFYHRAVNNSSKLYSASGGVAQADMDVGTSALNTTRKMAGRFATNDFAASLGGAAVVYDTSGSVPATPQNVYFGHEPGGANMLFGYLRRVAIWTRALTDAELQAVTT